MPIVTPCTFREPAKTYYLDPGDLNVMAGSHIVAETSRGLELGVAKFAPRPMDDDKIVPPLRSILRLATPEDILQNQKIAPSKTNFCVWRASVFSIMRCR